MTVNLELLDDESANEAIQSVANEAHWALAGGLATALSASVTAGGISGPVPFSARHLAIPGQKTQTTHQTAGSSSSRGRYHKYVI